jgi:thiosulfate/3-mercaptopyruvate sulfurtransferase
MYELYLRNMVKIGEKGILMTKAKIDNSIVSVQWLAENLMAENLIILDASMKPVGSVGNTASDLPVYIPGARRFDFDTEICDHNTSLPHMMPSPEFFTEKMQAMGIDNDSAIVIYDRVNIFSSPRAWWMFRAMGHEQAAVLDGGLPAWIQAGHETSPTLSTAKRRGNFASHPRPGMFVDSQAVTQALTNSAFTVMDARSLGRFNGWEPEPREGLRGGHMPGAVNLPYANVLENGMFKSRSSLQSLFEQYKKKKMIFSCGSGVTACILALAADQAGHKDLAVYDGSWSEWGRIDSGLPVVKE